MIRFAGELVDVQPMASPEQAHLVHAGKNGTPEVTDGPFPEAKEFLAGCWIVEAASLERACQIAASAPAMPGPGGVPLSITIEVRPVTGVPSGNV